ncbi:hypothetical protein PANA5342_2353 [Pantoea ananatis LMG 5342]|nr:hypothetical protein PANA5342_2353 [Pantoea ananatis LMG 5342]
MSEAEDRVLSSITVILRGTMANQTAEKGDKCVVF